LFNAWSDITDGAGNNLVTAYAVHRPDGDWSLLLINKDQENVHSVKISFDDSTQPAPGFFAGLLAVRTFGKAQYQWHPATLAADPDGPIATSTINGGPSTSYELPAASITVVRGKLKFPDAATKPHK
jgi:hypothetical protein